MLFTSTVFLLLFLPITLVLYYLPAMRKWQLGILLLAGFIFYGFNHPEFLGILLLSAGINAVSSYLAITAKSRLKRRLIAVLGVILNLCILSFFKYGNLLYSTFVGDLSGAAWLTAIPLPIGISFYTFQGIGLLVDVFRNNAILDERLRSYDMKKHFFHTIFFISFYPHSVAGPIVKAHSFLPQIKEKYFHHINFTFVFKTLVIGFFLKLVVADNIQNYTFWMAYPYFIYAGSIDLLFMMLGYSVQIFADFAGYSLIAIGIAALYGYQLPDNFNFPYIACSFKEFWKRWHMSLSSWLQEYLYYSLGGNRKGKNRTYLNLMLVMLLGGLWHGAAWNYLAWGGVHGLFLCLERMFGGGATPNIIR